MGTALADIRAAVTEALVRAATGLRPDVRRAMEAALDSEPSERARTVMRQLLDNDDIARRDRVPVCQDTGTVRVKLSVGSDLTDDELRHAADEAVRRASEQGLLRASIVRDALCDRSNTTDNTPALVHIERSEEPGGTVTVMLKGGGSDNSSAVAMLPPAVGAAGVADFVVEHVLAKATGACPPLLVGVGVGGTFDSVAGLSAEALLRPIGEGGQTCVGEIESELLGRINASGIGPAGLGGRTTALAVHVVTAPCHIAALPVAVNLGCCAIRSAAVRIE